MNKAELLKIAKPILFNTPMVQAILDGRKTKTRRIVKEKALSKFNFDSTGKLLGSFDGCDMYPSTDDAPYHFGDILYVRETWSPVNVRPKRYLYKTHCPEAENLPIKWHPSIHMPKEAARIFLRVTDVSVERLQDITVEGAINEGVPDVWIDEARPMKFVDVAGNRNMFVDIWDSTIKKTDLRYGWNANPFVWVIEFERLEIEK